MDHLDRCVIVVKPKQPYVDWVMGLPDADEGPIPTLQGLREEGTAYLLPDYVQDDYKDELLREHCEPIFEQELSAWHTLEDDYPPERTFEAFKQWFDVEWHSMVFDLVPSKSWLPWRR